jgi:hypothetical protein
LAKGLKEAVLQRRDFITQFSDWVPMGSGRNIAVYAAELPFARTSFLIKYEWK